MESLEATRVHTTPPRVMPLAARFRCAGTFKVLLFGMSTALDGMISCESDKCSLLPRMADVAGLELSIRADVGALARLRIPFPSEPSREAALVGKGVSSLVHPQDWAPAAAGSLSTVQVPLKACVSWKLVDIAHLHTSCDQNSRDTYALSDSPALQTVTS